jgi:molybdopterin converting factor small subunit
VRVHLGGYLSWYDSEKRAWLELDPRTIPTGSRDGLPSLLTPAGVAQHLRLPRGEIVMVAVNGRVVDPDSALLTQDDRVEFYPPIGGG